MTSPPGWYTDPAGSGGQRWWSGEQWAGEPSPAASIRSGAAIAFIVLAIVVATVLGFLTYTGAFRHSQVARVVRVENGRFCISPVGDPGTIDCLPISPPSRHRVGECLDVYYGEGISIEGKTTCPTSPEPD